MIKLGRNFTNTFVADVLKPEEKEKVLSGEIDLITMNALGLIEFKRNVLFQIDKAVELGINHIELDADIPSPYDEMPKDERKKIREYAAKKNISLSVHLPYSPSGAGGAVACLQESDRRAAVSIQKLYIDFARDIGAMYLNMHPGTLAFYMVSPIFMEKVEKSIVESLCELSDYAKGMKFHVENNVSFDTIYTEPEDLVRIVEKSRHRGAEVYLNLDIGHWLTRAEKGKEIPENPENVMKKIPKEFVCELHLNDYVPKKIIFHPPLHTTEGPLKEENLIRYGEIVKTLEPEVIILETACKTKEQVASTDTLLREEMEYVRRCLKI